MSSEAQLQEVVRILLAKWQPSARRIFKPQQSGNGVALAINLRLDPQFGVGEDGSAFVNRKESEGGFFFETVPQLKEKSAEGHAQFGWKNGKREYKGIIAKLGMPDISGMLAAYENVRLARRGVPASLRPKATTEHPSGDPTSLSLFHKSPGGGSCVITWKFDEDSSSLRLSRSKDHSYTIKLTRSEEVIVKNMLEKALDAFNDLGYN